jgi:hypothetical protein
MMVSSMVHGAYGKGAVSFWCVFGILSTCSAFIISRKIVKAKQVSAPPEQRKHSLIIVIVASTMLTFALSVLVALGVLFTVGLQPLENYLENYYLLHMFVGTLIFMPLVAKYLRS